MTIITERKSGKPEDYCRKKEQKRKSKGAVKKVLKKEQVTGL